MDTSDITVIKGIDQACIEEAIRVVKESFTWIPAKLKGKNVSSYIRAPVIFSLSEEERKKLRHRHTEVRKDAEFPGGYSAYIDFLSKNIRFPKAATDSSIVGTVTLRFVIRKNGRIDKSSIQVVRRLGGGCTEEAIRAIKLMPKWKPARLNGRRIRTQMSLDVKFTYRW
jgi:hypothetical protein